MVKRCFFKMASPIVPPSIFVFYRVLARAKSK